MGRKRVAVEQGSLFEPPGKLLYGDNLEMLRREVKEESVDLVYLDPPFNSKRAYNVLFKERDERESAAQAKAFEDYWRWGPQAVQAFQRLTGTQAEERGVPAKLAELAEALHRFIGPSDMLAYLVMMAERLVALRRVLKPTGSLYLHCDPTASHYLRLVLDAVFGHAAFRNEIIWKRTTAHSGAKKFAPIHDVLLYYARGDAPVWNTPRTEYDGEYLDKYYRFDDGDGRLYWRADLCAAGIRHGRSGVPWRGIDPTAKGMHWKFTVERLDELDAEGRIYWPPRGTMPQYKRYRDELKGVAVGDIWSDIDRINPVGSERTGWATQKPVALLERIIAASSNPGDLVLDPFCGCGTAVEAAQKLGRRWIGIDVTYLAIDIVKKRLSRVFPNAELYREVGAPRDVVGARALAEKDRRDATNEFQRWAVPLIGANHAGEDPKQMKRGMDRGIDGYIRFKDDPEGGSKKVLLSVKSGKVSSRDIRDLRGTMEREKAPIGVFITLNQPTREMVKEAAEAGTWSSAAFEPGRSFDRIQFLTIEDIFAGKRPQYPGQTRPGRSTAPPPPSKETGPKKGLGVVDVRGERERVVKVARTTPEAAPARRRRAASDS